jgi:hypothetical protein
MRRPLNSSSSLQALPLIVTHSRTSRYLTLNEPTVYQRFNRKQRIGFWRPMPPMHAHAAGTRPPTFHFVDSEKTLESFSESSDYKANYPSFTGKSLTHPSSQIPSIRFSDDGAFMEVPRTLQDIREDDESDDMDPFPYALQKDDVKLRQVTSRQPGVGTVDSITSEPAEFGAMRSSNQLRVELDMQVPQINIVSPSTIASSTRFARPRFGRPTTAWSTNSGSTASTAHSAKSDASSLLRKAAPSFPEPPQRPAEAVTKPTFQPRAWLDSRIYDKARLVQGKAKPQPPPELAVVGLPGHVVPSPSVGAMRQPPPSRPSLGRSTSERDARSVRFDERHRSTASNSSGLVEFIPAKAPPGASGRPRSEIGQSRVDSSHFTSYYPAYEDAPPHRSSTTQPTRLSFVTDSQYSSEPDMLPLLRQDRMDAPSYTHDPQTVPDNVSSPPTSRRPSQDLSRSRVTPCPSEDGGSRVNPFLAGSNGR